MPYNGSGTFTLVTGNPVVTGTVINSTVHNNTQNDIAAGLTNVITRDGQSVPFGNLPMGGFKHTGAAAATVAGQYLVQGQSGAALASLTVNGVSTEGNATTLRADLANTSDVAKGDALLGVTQPYVGASARTQHDKNSETVSITDFSGVVGDGVSDCTAGIQAALNSGATIVMVPPCTAFYKTTAPIKIPAGVSLRGHQKTAMIGTTVQTGKPQIRKTTNTTVGIPRFNDAVVVQRDCVLYAEYAFAGAFYPQNFEVSGLSITNTAFTTSTIGIYHEEGSNWCIEDCDIFGMQHGIYARNIWISRFTNVKIDGKFTVEVGGTSLVLTNVSSTGPRNGFDLTALGYSTLIGCTSDAGSNPAYKLAFCQGIALIGCGTESNSSVSTTRGWAIAFEGGNTASVVGFVSVALAASTTPIFSLTSNDIVTFESCNMSEGRAAAPGVQDVYCNFACLATFNNCLFLLSGGVYTYDSPLVGFAGTGRVLVNAGPVTKSLSSGASQTFARTPDGYVAGADVSALGARYYAKTPAAYGGAAFRSDSDTAAALSWFHLYGTSSTGTVANVAIYGNGNIQNANNSYGALSDAKLKQDVEDAGSNWSDFKAYRFRKYRFKADPTGGKQLGVIADELQKVSPGLVDEMDDFEEDQEGNRSKLGTKTKSVKYSVLYLKACVVIQELMARVEALESKT